MRFPTAISRVVTIFLKFLLRLDRSGIGCRFLGSDLSFRPGFGIGIHLAIIQLAGYVRCWNRRINRRGRIVHETLTVAITILYESPCFPVTESSLKVLIASTITGAMIGLEVFLISVFGMRSQSQRTGGGNDIGREECSA